jgi:hypothetical protein
VTDASGLNATGYGMGVATGDYNNDGCVDLYVTALGRNQLFRNNGNGTFTDVSKESRTDDTGWSTSAAFVDYDRDGWPDLFVGHYLAYTTDANSQCYSVTGKPDYCPPHVYSAQPSHLFHNNRNGTFTDVTVAAGMSREFGPALGVSTADFNGDGWLDIYVANDISDNVFYHNTGGKFEDISHPALVADYRSAMGLAAGDFDRDGDDDLFIVHWVAQENALYENLWGDYNTKRSVGADVRRLTNEIRAERSPVTPVTTNKYPLRFMDIADSKGLGQIALPYVGWGTEFADFDGDGWLDIIVANGNTLEAEGPMPRKLKPQECFLFWNRRAEFFHNIAPLSKPLSELHSSRGLALSDYDNDGDMDIVVAQLGEGVQLLRNDTQTGHWLKVRLRSWNRNHQPIGFGDGTKMFAHFYRGGYFNGTGMRFFLGYASLGQIVNNRFCLDLELASQFINTNLIRICHCPPGRLLLLAILVRNFG